MSISISTGSVGASKYVRAASATKAAAAVASVTETDSSDSSKVSGPAAMMSKLKALQKSDPAKFKEAVTAVSRKLSEEAESATDDKQKSMLSDLAKKFESAGESGDLSALQRPQGARAAAGAKGGGGGPPPGGGGMKGASSSSSSSSTEPADANADGSVTQAEQLAYDRKQEVKTSPASSETKRAAQAYKKIQGDDLPGGTKATMESISSVVGQYAA